jgi:hypothetical protein
MSPRELEQAIEALAGECEKCARWQVHITWRHGDLKAAARKCARRQSATNLAAVASAKAALANDREHASLHFTDHLSVRGG